MNTFLICLAITLIGLAIMALQMCIEEWKDGNAIMAFFLIPCALTMVALAKWIVQPVFQ
jgi:hypothetical protein